MDMKEYLKKFAEEVPAWMLDYAPGTEIDFVEVLKSRIVYYPGAYVDGQPVHTFVQAHAAHVFMYVDYMLSWEKIREELSEHGFKGYRILASVKAGAEDLTPRGWTPHVKPTREQFDRMNRFASAERFANLVIFERGDDYDDAHGPVRFAVIFIGGDGIATYDAIFCNGNAPAPFCVVLQDHGFGGNWSHFGRGGLMERAARESGAYPEYLLAATGDSTEVWEGYARIPDAPSVLGGMYHGRRELFGRPSPSRRF